MAIAIPSEQDVLTQTLNYFRLQFPSEDLSDRSFFGLIARIFASEVITLSQSILAASYESPPGQQTSSVGLDNWAFIFGLSNGKGGYGRRGAVPSSGGSAIISGLANTVFTAGLTAVDSTSQIIVALDSNVQIPAVAPLTVSGTFSALIAGSASNLPSGSLLTWQSPPAGAAPTFTLINPLIGGEDIETDAALLDRILFRIQNPPKGGTAADYRRWAEESTDANGISNDIIRAYIYPLKSGTGSVDIIITQPGTGTGRIPGNAKIKAVQAYIDARRPVTAKAYVRANPTIQMPSAKALTITIRGIPNLPKYAFDWDDQTNAHGANANFIPVSAYTIGTQQITIPANNQLAAAVDQGLISGVFPTIAYYAFNGTSLPYILTVNSRTGNTIFYVTSNIPVSPSIGNDVLNAGSVMTIPVLTAVKNFIDNLGPSRNSGYADNYDPWSSTVSLAEVSKIALNTIDSDGNTFLLDIPNVGEDPLTLAPGIGVQIKIGGVTTAIDYTPKDVLGIPEIAFLSGGGLRLGRS